MFIKVVVQNIIFMKMEAVKSLQNINIKIDIRLVPSFVPSSIDISKMTKY